uniref:WASH complex subunit strumpellin n=1 Tax=Globodera rostochiensis TaxID=31243 RepID=A0A914I929_GLORO
MYQNKWTNGCAQLVDDLTFTGNCVIAEIHRLALLVPKDFSDISSSAFNKLLIDFSYFENRDSFDHFTEGSEEGRQLDKEFYSRFGPYLEMFGRLVDKFYDFILDISDFSTDFLTYKEQFARFKCVEQLEMFGAQLLYLLGFVLLLIDQKFPQEIRERIFVAFYRLRTDIPLKKLETVVNVFRNRREAYESSFLSIGIDECFIQKMITFLQFYKGPKLGWLENAIYVCLYFDPSHDTLNNQFSTMRQIIDNSFASRWVLHLHVDFQVNLFEKWSRFKAANAAIANAWDTSRAVGLADAHFSTLRCATFPSTGLLSVEKFDDYEKLLLDCNAAIKWLILHHSKDEFINCHVLNTNFGRLLSMYDPIGNAVLAFLRNSLGIKPDRRTERIVGWLDSVKCSIEDMAPSLVAAGADCVTFVPLDQLSARISEVLQSQYDSNIDHQQLLLRQCLVLARSDLRRLRNRNCVQMEQLLQAEALSVKFIFLKVAESVQTLVWGSNCNEVKRNKLCSFYYSLLELKLRAVIQAVPRSIFHEMAKLTDCFPSDTSSVSIGKTRIREFADFERRRTLADLTFQISKLARGISNTCIKQLGDVEIQPRALLADGLRRELNTRLKQIFATNGQPNNILKTLQSQSVKFHQFRRSFLFICDHVGIRDGIRMWTEQIKCILAESLKSKTTKTAEGSSPIVSSISQPKLMLEKLYDFIISATAPQSTKYSQMESVWRSADGKFIKFSYNVFASLENWMLSGLNALTAAMLAKEVAELKLAFVKRAFGTNRSLPASRTALLAQLSSPEFALSGPNRELLLALGRLGQQFLLLCNLQLFVKAEAHSQLGTVHTTEQTLRRITKWEDALNTNKNLSVIGFNGELVDTICRILPLKSANGQLFLFSVILYFSYCVNDQNLAIQKVEKMDGVAVIEGAKLMLQHSPLWRHLTADAKYLFLHENPTIFRHSLPIFP